MNSFKFFFVIILLFHFQIIHAQWIINHNSIPQPNIPKPTIDTHFTDPEFNTEIIRITDARSSGMPGICPDYSKRAAWNTDESYLLLRTGFGDALLYDGSTYQFIKTLDEVYGEDVFWHPSDPDIILFNPVNLLCSFYIKTGAIDTLHEFSDYTFANSRAEGNLSRDGRFYAVVGIEYDTINYNSIFRSILLYDISGDSIISRLALPDTLVDFDWVSVSPLGNYVVVDYATPFYGRFNGVEVYNRNMNFIWQQPLGFGHSDLTVDENGDECLVMDYYDENENKTIIKKIRLSDGAQTNLLDVNWSFNLHISCRNIMDNQWCIISTFDGEGRLEDDSTNWLPFENEIFALKLDGSGDVRRLAHHHSRRFSPITPDRDNSIYYAEPHATASKRGDRILFGSNWRQQVQSDTSVDSYIIDLRNLIQVENYPSIINGFKLYQNFPNPFNPSTTIKYSIPSVGTRHGVFVQIKVYDILGNEVATLVNEEKPAGIYEVEFSAGSSGDARKLSSGIYFYRLEVNNFNDTKKFMLLK
jgi:hypothetical protein